MPHTADEKEQAEKKAKLQELHEELDVTNPGLTKPHFLVSNGEGKFVAVIPQVNGLAKARKLITKSKSNLKRSFSRKRYKKRKYYRKRRRYY